MTATRLLRSVAWLLMLAIAFCTLVPIGLRPVVSSSPDIERFTAFALTGLAFGIAYPRHRILILFVVVGLGGLLEAAQTLIASRHGRVPDFELKAVGGALGVGLSCLPTAWLVRLRGTGEARSAAAATHDGLSHARKST